MKKVCSKLERFGNCETCFDTILNVLAYCILFELFSIKFFRPIRPKSVSRDQPKNVKNISQNSFPTQSKLARFVVGRKFQQTANGLAFLNFRSGGQRQSILKKFFRSRGDVFISRKSFSFLYFFLSLFLYPCTFKPFEPTSISLYLYLCTFKPFVPTSLSLSLYQCTFKPFVPTSLYLSLYISMYL